jgi:cytochrome c oxidase cbb3-type subunit 3
MAVEGRDPHTGYLTTGHVWNGIKELNTPVPRVVYFFLAVTAAFAVVYWLLMPAWPLGVTYTKGLLGIDQRRTVAEALEQAKADRAAWVQRIVSEDFAAIQADPEQMRIVRQMGHSLFGDNCAVCHGAGGKGGPGYPSLASGSWLWGGDPETIAETLRVGINSTHADTRAGQMLAFGRDQILTRAEIGDVVTYVQSLSDPSLQVDPDRLAAGKEIFAANCVSCHGEDGKGLDEFGAPDLTDESWIYGGDRQTIFATVYGGRQGHMPTWESRLTPFQRKILALYVADLRAAK